jgi:DNA-binding NarL/FixJ family response regulator
MGRRSVRQPERLREGDLLPKDLILDRLIRRRERLLWLSLALPKRMREIDDELFRRNLRHVDMVPVEDSAKASPREREVWQGIMENLSNKQIAERLGIAERTVKFHVGKLLRRKNLKNRGDLYRCGIEPFLKQRSS